jgi:hypothetical protein
MHVIMKLAKKGKAEEAQELNKPLELPCKNLFCESNPIPTKWAATRMGLISSAYCRLHHWMFWTRHWKTCNGGPPSSLHVEEQLMGILEAAT